MGIWPPKHSGSLPLSIFLLFFFLIPLSDSLRNTTLCRFLPSTTFYIYNILPQLRFMQRYSVSAPCYDIFPIKFCLSISLQLPITQLTSFVLPYKCESNTVQFLFQLLNPISHIYTARLKFIALLYRIIDFHTHNRYQNSTVTPIKLPLLLYLQIFILANPFDSQVVSRISVFQNLLCTFFISSHASFNPHTSTPCVVSDSHNFCHF